MTVLVLLIFLSSCQLPLYGVPRTQSSDPFYLLRVILASNRGTLMELGIAPIVTSGMLVDYLSGMRVISIDKNSPEDRKLLEGLKKVIGIGMTLFLSVAYVLSGMYGDLSALGTGNAVLVSAQLFLMGVVMLLLDELLLAGYGMGSGTMLFMATNVCETIVWSALSPTSVTTASRGKEYTGAVFAFFHLLYVRPNKIAAVWEALARTHLPNLLQLVSTLVVFVVVIYFQGWRSQLPVKYQRYRANENTYPIKLFYTGNKPVVLLTSMLSQVYVLSQMAFRMYPTNVLVKLLGEWSSDAETGAVRPVGGLVRYLSPPLNLGEVLFDPFRALFYLFFVLTACAIFAKSWIHVAGTSASSVAGYLRDQNMMVKGYRDSTMKDVLNRYIPASAILGGMIVGAISVLADFLGALGSGTGILLAVTIIYQYYEIFTKESHAAGGVANMLAM